MNSDMLPSELEKHENVKERLNTLLHKKIHDQYEKHYDNSHKLMDSTEEKSSIFHHGESSSEPVVEITENCDDDLTSTSNEGSILSQYILHHVLNEKKKELLRNKEVIQFLRNKLKYS